MPVRFVTRARINVMPLQASVIRQLIDVLWEKAIALERLKRDTEAITTWEEVASLARQIVQDSALCASALDYLSYQFRRLKRHDDAVRTGTLATTYQDEAASRAMRYFCLSGDLQQLRRYKESGEAAQKSVMLYRHLAIRDPKTWMGDLAKGLSNLAHSLAALGDCSEALIVWKESAIILSNFLDTHTETSLDAIEGYCYALDITLDISLILKDDEECLEVCSTAVQYLYQLSELYPQNERVTCCVFWANFSYAYNMRRVGRLYNAQQYVEKWLDTQRGKPEVISECKMAWWKATMITLQAGTLDAQGYTKQALLAIQKIHDILWPYVNTYAPCLCEMIEFMVQMAQLQVNLGNNEGALQVAEGMLRLYQDSELEPNVANLAWYLYGVALTALACRNYKRAVEAAREGCDTIAKSGWQTLRWEPHMFIRPSLLAFLSYAEANLGKCSTALEYAHSAVNTSLEIGDMKAYMSATAAERSLMETRGNLADILLATGDLAQARQICEERSAYFSKRVETRMGDYREWAPILRMLGVLCCSEGRHDEGEAAAQELSRIIETLGSVFPSLLGQVRTRLRHQASVPILTVLADMGEKLDCGHQAEVLSLFAN
ncbi:hypothetical protein D9619_008410 [Psilocybe cf. subviscida]|uniref:Uncharacterized protein n=1 Tax=Psilocybe cf. subviscida TaxID=2480587 RepID=A0A8H5F0W1_9AGAR|nr:hypothetical protein D9619_008410 [Psilocybe cf. subviscida]